MANLFYKDCKWWLNYRVNGKRYRRSTGTSNKKLAKVKLNKLEVKLFRGQAPDIGAAVSNSGLPEFFHRFVEYAKNNYSSQHLGSDLPRIRVLQEFFARRGVRDLGSITPGIYEEFESTVLRGRKLKTKKNYLSLLKTMLNYAQMGSLRKERAI